MLFRQGFNLQKLKCYKIFNKNLENIKKINSSFCYNLVYLYFLTNRKAIYYAKKHKIYQKASYTDGAQGAIPSQG